MRYELNIGIDGLGDLEELYSIFSPASIEGLNRIGITSAYTAMTDYHREFDASKSWSNLSLPTHGPGRKRTGFGLKITEGWREGKVSADGASLVNDNPQLGFKITGGKITAKKAKALTIPMVPEAHGLRVADYPEKLFRPKGKDYLAETIGKSEIRVVYLLRKSVTQGPVDGALPDDEDIIEPFVEAILDHLDQIEI